MAYNPNESKLGFVVRDNGEVGYSDTLEDLKPLKWMTDYARVDAIRLSSGLMKYDCLEFLALKVREIIHKYFDTRPKRLEAVAMLVCTAHRIYERFQAVPYLRFLGISGSGKTRATEVIGSMCYRPLAISGAMTPASIFRMIEAVGGTMLIDEADFQDSNIGADVAKILNCGYQKRMPVTRMEAVGNGYEPRLYEVFGPKIINGRKPFKDDATESRCLTHTPVLTST